MAPPATRHSALALALFTALAAAAGLPATNAEDTPVTSTRTRTSGSVATYSTSSVVSLFLPGFDSMPLVGSVVSVGDSKTVYAIACPPGTDSSDCGLVFDENSATVTEGPSTVEIEVSYADMTISLGCSVSGNNAGCIENVSGSASGVGAYDSVTSLDISTFSEMMIPVTLTAGLEALSGGSPTTSTASATGSSTSGASQSGTTKTSQTSSSSTAAAMPRMTQNAMLLGVAAAAAAVGGAVVM